MQQIMSSTDPEAQDIFLIRGLIDQFTALKKRVDENPHLDNSAMRVLKTAITQLMEIPHLRTQVDEYFTLLELDESSTLKEQTATNNPTWETEGKMVGQMESPASLRTLEALEELNDVSFTLNELMDENFIPKELKDGNPRQRGLVDEYSALNDPEAKVIFLLRELIDQFTALKKLVDENPQLDKSAMRELKAAITQLKEKVDENPHLRAQVDEYFALIELDGEYSTLKQQTATDNIAWETEGKMVEQMQSPASLLMRCHMDLIPLTQNVESAKAKEKELEKERGEINMTIKVMEEELLETEEIQNEQKEKFESVQDSREEQPDFRVLLNGASQSEEKSSNEQELSLERESKQEDEIRPLIQQNILLQEVPFENHKESIKKEKKEKRDKEEKKKQEKKEKRDKEEKKKQEKKEKRDKEEKKKQEKKEKQEKKKMEEKEMRKIEKEKKEIEKKKKQETEKMEKIERKEKKKLKQEKKEIEKKEKQETEKREKMERKERKKIEKEKSERERKATGKWYSFLFKCCI